jgi:hypothetical protein
MQTIDTWTTLSETEFNEGRGPRIVVGRFFSREHAENVVKDQRYRRYCVMGYKSHDAHKDMVTHEVLHICHAPEEFWENTIEERRKKALAKLDASDIDALGIKI